MTSIVSLRYYDVSRGLAKALAAPLLGSTTLEGVWHTGVEVFGLEFFFGGGGVQRMDPSAFELEHALKPTKIVPLGQTTKTLNELDSYVREISPRFTAVTYDLLEWNCNHFSNEVVKFLLGSELPANVLRQHAVLEDSPMGRSILQMIRGANLANPVGRGALSPSSLTRTSTREPSPLTGSPSSQDELPDFLTNVLRDLPQRESQQILAFLDDICQRVIRNSLDPEKRSVKKDTPGYHRFVELAGSEIAPSIMTKLGFQNRENQWEFPPPNATLLRDLMAARRTIQDRINSPTVSDADRWSNQLSKLEAMGFNDRSHNLRILRSVNGNLNGAIDQLVMSSDD